MEGCPKPSIAILKTQHFHYGSGQTPAHAAPGQQNANGSRGLGRPLLAKSKDPPGGVPPDPPKKTLKRPKHRNVLIIWLTR